MDVLRTVMVYLLVLFGAPVEGGQLEAVAMMVVAVALTHCFWEEVVLDGQLR